MPQGTRKELHLPQEMVPEILRMLEDLEHPFTPMTHRQQTIVDDVRRMMKTQGNIGKNAWGKLKKIHELRTLKLPLPGEII